MKLLSTKDEAIQTLKSFIDEVEREKAPNRVSIIRSDCGGEFFNKELNNHFSKLGIKRVVRLLILSIRMVLQKELLVW